MISVKNTKLRDTHADILEKSIPLFAVHGYSGVSMRNISTAVGISAAALYHHFPDKQTLYLDAMQYAFADKSTGIKEVVSTEGTPPERLERFIYRFTEMVASDPEFMRLMHREMLDGDEARLKLLAEHVFLDTYQTITELITELDVDWDPPILVNFIAGLVLYHYESASMRRFLPGVKPEHDDPVVVARHVNRLLQQALGISG